MTAAPMSATTTQTRPLVIYSTSTKPDSVVQQEHQWYFGCIGRHIAPWSYPKMEQRV
jgi:hypothetical protein